MKARPWTWIKSFHFSYKLFKLPVFLGHDVNLDRNYVKLSGFQTWSESNRLVGAIQFSRNKTLLVTGVNIWPDFWSIQMDRWVVHVIELPLKMSRRCFIHSVSMDWNVILDYLVSKICPFRIEIVRIGHFQIRSTESSAVDKLISHFSLFF